MHLQTRADSDILCVHSCILEYLNAYTLPPSLALKQRSLPSAARRYAGLRPSVGGILVKDLPHARNRVTFS